MVAGKRQTPILEDAHQPPVGKMRLDQVLRHIGQPKTSQHRVQPQGYIVEDQLSFDPNPELAAVLLELPRINAAIGRQTQIDAIVIRKILGVSGFGLVVK